jgi:hypothetical protein
MQFWRKQASFNASFSRISQITFVIKDVVYAIHEQVVGDEEEKGCYPEAGRKFATQEEISRRKRKGSVYP